MLPMILNEQSMLPKLGVITKTFMKYSEGGNKPDPLIVDAWVFDTQIGHSRFFK